MDVTVHVPVTVKYYYSCCLQSTVYVVLGYVKDLLCNYHISPFFHMYKTSISLVKFNV